MILDNRRPQPADLALEAEGLCKSYGDLVALADLTLAVKKGEVVCLLGANGAGKTTTINCFLGFHAPDRGRARIDGIDVQEDPLAARRRVAYLPESVALYDRLTGLENLAFFDRLTGHHRGDDELSQLLSQAGLEPQAHGRRVGAFSKGMRQKVGIAIALAKGAVALLLDEPLSGLDPAAAHGLGEQILELRDTGCGVLMATHDIFRAKAIGDRIGIMMRGRLVNVLDADTLDAGEIEAIYLKHLQDAAVSDVAAGAA